jgi:hypothetical protein
MGSWVKIPTWAPFEHSAAAVVVDTATNGTSPGPRVGQVDLEVVTLNMAVTSLQLQAPSALTP